MLQIPTGELPEMSEVEVTIANLTADEKCTLKQAVRLSEQLSFLSTWPNDKRPIRYSPTEIIAKSFFEHPVWLGKKAFISMLSTSKWLPAPVEISDEQAAVYSHDGVAISRSTNFKIFRRRIDKSKRSDCRIKKDVDANISFRQTVLIDFTVNKIIEFKGRTAECHRKVDDLDYIKLNNESRKNAERLANKKIDPEPNHWPKVDEYLSASNITQICKMLGLSNWFECLADYTVWTMLHYDLGYCIGDIDKTICMSGFNQLTATFEAAKDQTGTNFEIMGISYDK
ncbi:MAG: hypothetical protein HRU29_15340 [Rhizobiales bacterium]|nr:hypothetical protein [Hyphomicrobiales bacterium]NRB15770.1 hypothetical protein [Hyphomicrobiales bacterium]